MTEIIDLAKRREAKKQKTDLDIAYDNHDTVLDLCDEVFPEGAMVIAIVDGELEVSMTIEDQDTAITALYSVLNKMVEK